MSSIERYQSPEAEERAFAMLERKVNALVKSALIPDAVRGKPGDALLVALKGHELGLSFTASFSHLFVVNGRIGQSAQLLADEAARAGYEVYIGESDTKAATAHVVNRRTGQRHSLTWTIEEAQRAGLTDKPNWKAYPAAMLRARAISNAVRAFCRGIVLPADLVLETPDELGADVIEFEEPERELPRPQGGFVDASARAVEPDPSEVVIPAAPKDSGGGDSEGSRAGDATTAPASEAPAGDSDEEPERENSYARAIHILAHELGLKDEQVDEILFETIGDVSANAVNRDNCSAVVQRLRQAAGKAA